MPLRPNGPTAARVGAIAALLTTLVLPADRVAAQNAAGEAGGTPADVRGPDAPPDDAQGAPADGEEDEEYRALVAQALDEFRARRWAEARALFRRAHAVEPNARTLRGIAMSSFELREYAAAIRAIDAALVHPARPLTEAQRAHVLGLRERAEAFVARYQVRLEPPDAEVRVDGVRAPLPDGEVVVDLGVHTLRVVADGHRPWERRVRVVGGERQTLAIDLEPSSSAGEPGGDAMGDEPPDEPLARQTESPSRDDTAAHALLVGGGLALAAAAGAIGYWVDREGALGECDATPCRNEGAIRTERDWGLALTVGLGAAALGLTATGALLLLTPADAPGGRGVRCAPAPLGAACVGRF